MFYDNTPALAVRLAGQFKTEPAGNSSSSVVLFNTTLAKASQERRTAFSVVLCCRNTIQLW